MKNHSLKHCKAISKINYCQFTLLHTQTCKVIIALSNIMAVSFILS